MIRRSWIAGQDGLERHKAVRIVIADKDFGLVRGDAERIFGGFLTQPGPSCRTDRSLITVSVRAQDRHQTASYVRVRIIRSVGQLATAMAALSAPPPNRTMKRRAMQSARIQKGGEGGVPWHG